MKPINFTRGWPVICDTALISTLLLFGAAAPALAGGQQNLTLNGTYSLRSLGYDQSCSHADTAASGAAGPGCPFSSSGILVFDGQGHITGGTIFTNYGFNGATNGGGGCVYQSSAGGTDTVNADGTVIISLTTTVASETIGGITNPCSGPTVGSSGTDVLAGAVTDGGKQVDFTEIGQSPPSKNVFTVDSGVLTQQRPPAATFAGTPGQPNCHGKSVSALARQYGGFKGATDALGYSSVKALQSAIDAFCAG
jgi:hypothetical protein